MASFSEVLLSAWSALQGAVLSSLKVGPPVLSAFTPLLTTLLVIFPPLLLLFAFPGRVSRALQSVPGPPGVPLLGNSLEILRSGFNNCQTRWLLAYGSLFKYEIGHGNVVLAVADPELVQQLGVRQFKKFPNRIIPRWETTDSSSRGLIFSKGAYWTGVRSTVQPLFHSARLQHFGDIMHECVDVLVARLEQAAAGDQSINLLDWLMELTLDVLGLSVFGVKFDNQVGWKINEGSSLVRNVSQIIEDADTVSAFAIFAVLVPSFLRGPVMWLARTIPGTVDYVREKSMRIVLAESQKIIEQRRKEITTGDQSRRDFLSLLTQATDRSSGTQLSDDCIRMLVLEFMLAGTHTTADTISFAVYLLAKHPAVEEKLVHEVRAFYDKLDEAGADNVEKRPSYDELVQFPFVEQVVQEVMRLYPAAPITSRECLEDCHVGDLQLPKETKIVFPIYAMHHNPDVFPEPEEFQPERFLPEETQKRHPCSYLPFGVGPRMCIGYRFAMEEAKLVLIRIYRQLTFELVKEKLPSSGQLELQMGVVLKPKDGMWVIPKNRPQYSDKSPLTF